MTGEEGPEKWQIARDAVDDLLVQVPSKVPIPMLTFAGSGVNGEDECYRSDYNRLTLICP